MRNFTRDSARTNKVFANRWQTFHATTSFCHHLLSLGIKTPEFCKCYEASCNHFVTQIIGFVGSLTQHKRTWYFKNSIVFFKLLDIRYNISNITRKASNTKKMLVELSTTHEEEQTYTIHIMDGWTIDCNEKNKILITLHGWYCKIWYE